jgi:hypothetical protein
MDGAIAPIEALNIRTLCRGQKKERTFQAAWLLALEPNEAQELARGLETVLRGRSYSSARRSLRAFQDLIETVVPTCNTLSSPAKAEPAIRDWLRGSLAKRGSIRGFLNSHDNWRSLRKVLVQLMSLGVIPLLSLPGFSRKADSLARITRTEPTVLDKLRLSDDHRRALSLPATSDGAFFDCLDAKSSKLLAAIKAAAIEEIRGFERDFAHGRSLIQRCDIDRLRYFIRRGVAHDPDIKCKGQKQKPSFFSPHHPDGLVNSIGWAHYENGGIFYDRAWQGAAHCYHHIGGLNTIRTRLGLTIESITALMTYLIAEMGFNVDSLEQAQIKDSRNRIRLVLPTDVPGRLRIAVPKERAQKILYALTPANDDFNADQAVSLAIALGATWRANSSETALWLHHGNRKANKITTLSSTGFKIGFAGLLSRHPDIGDLLDTDVSRKDVRVLAGIVEWFSTGGDMIATARKLNNSPKTALKNYIPKELQDAFYAHQIRKFQNLLIMAASLDDPGLACKILRYDSLEQLETELKAMLVDPVLSASPLFARVNVRTLNTIEAATITEGHRDAFLLSERNVLVLSRLNDAILSIQSSNLGFSPQESWTENTPRYWQSLWHAVSRNMDGSLDRALKRIWMRGLALAANQDIRVDFPPLYLPKGGNQ